MGIAAVVGQFEIVAVVHIETVELPGSTHLQGRHGPVLRPVQL